MSLSPEKNKVKKVTGLRELFDLQGFPFIMRYSKTRNAKSSSQSEPRSARPELPRHQPQLQKLYRLHFKNLSAQISKPNIAVLQSWDKLAKDIELHKIVTLYGVQGSGRSSFVRWFAIRNNLRLYEVDLQGCSTQHRVVRQVIDSLSQGLCKKSDIVLEEFDFKRLDQLFTNRRAAFLFSNFQNMVKHERLIYSLIDWVKTKYTLFAKVNKYTFEDSMEKRVKSRYTSKNLHFMFPSQADVVTILCQKSKVTSFGMLQQFFRGQAFNSWLREVLELGPKLTNLLRVIMHAAMSISLNYQPQKVSKGLLEKQFLLQIKHFWQVSNFKTAKHTIAQLSNYEAVVFAVVLLFRKNKAKRDKPITMAQLLKFIRSTVQIGAKLPISNELFSTLLGNLARVGLLRVQDNNGESEYFVRCSRQECVEALRQRDLRAQYQKIIAQLD